jgi:MFS family permease
MIGLADKRLIWTFSLCGLVAIFSSTLSKTPVLPLFASNLGASDVQVGLIAAASTLPGILISYIAGAMSDRYGWRRLLLISLFIFSTAPIFYLLLDNYYQLAGIRFYHGFATAILGPVAMAAIVSVSGARKGEMLSLYSSSTIIGRAAAPFVGGFLLASWGFNGLFLVCAIAGTAALILGAGFWGRFRQGDSIEITKKDAENGGLVKNLWSLLRHKKLLLLGLLEAAVFFAYGAFEIIFPLYAMWLGAAVWQIGIIMGLQLAGVIIFKPVFGRLSDRVSRAPVILSGLILCALTIGGLSFWDSIIGLGVLNVGFGIGFALVTSSTRPFAAELVQSNQLGASLGVLSTLMDIGHMAGPPVLGMLTVIMGYRAGFLMLAVGLIMITLICGYFLLRATKN